MSVRLSQFHQSLSLMNFGLLRFVPSGLLFFRYKYTLAHNRLLEDPFCYCCFYFFKILWCSNTYRGVVVGCLCWNLIIHNSLGLWLKKSSLVNQLKVKDKVLDHAQITWWTFLSILHWNIGWLYYSWMMLRTGTLIRVKW